MHDLRFALRSLAKSPGFTAVAAFMIALGIGLVAIQFSFINGALLKGLPFPRADRLLYVAFVHERGYLDAFSGSEYLAVRDEQRSFAALAAYTGESIDLAGDGFFARHYSGAAISAGLLDVLGVRPIMGRALLPADEQPGAPRVLLLSQLVWQHDFAGDPNIVGRTVRLQGEPATIVGIMPEGFGFPKYQRVWSNLRLTRDNNGGRFEVIGRLRDGVTIAAAQAEFDILASRRGQAEGDSTHRNQKAYVVPFTEKSNTRDFTVLLLTILAVACGVLALACVNVANLLSARAVRRGHELAVRAALGATRSHLIRQLLAESLVLAAVGAVGGIVLALWGVPLLNHELAASPKKPFWIVIDLDYRVLAATVGLTALVGLGSGLHPAWRATRGDPAGKLKDMTGGPSTNLRLGRFNRGLVTVQVLISCALLVITGILIDGARQSGEIDLPYSTETTLGAELDLPRAAFPDATARLAFFNALLSRLRTLPGIEAATLTDRHPVAGGGRSVVETPAHPGEAAESGGRIEDAAFELRDASESIAAGFFHDLQVPLREGREFTDTDTAASPPVAVVNESFARRHWPAESALGKLFRRALRRGAAAGQWLTVVGVAPDLHMEGVMSAGNAAGYYTPLSQDASAQVKVLLRTRGGAAQSLAKPLQEAVHALAPDLPVARIQTVAARRDEELRDIRTVILLTSAFGIGALVLAAIGIFAITAFAVQQRTREFGIRIALGAKTADVRALIFRQAGRQLALGLVAGLGLGWLASLPLQSAMATKLGPSGTALYFVVAVAVTATVTLACWLPARRATRVNPIEALRAE